MFQVYLPWYMFYQFQSGHKQIWYLCQIKKFLLEYVECLTTLDYTLVQRKLADGTRMLVG